MDTEDSAPRANEQPDLLRPNVSRIYDYMLGGNHNFAADREFVGQVQARLPSAAEMAASNRAFLRRVVRFCAAEGMDQFLDLGSGIPTTSTVHEIARAANPATRVAYVDIDPVAVAHGEQILAGLDGVTITGADMRDPRAVLAAPGVRSVIDLDRPVAVLMTAVLHFVAPEEDPGGVVADYRDAMATGSLLGVSHGSADLSDPSDREAMLIGERLYRDGGSPIHLRDRDGIAALMDGFTLVEPGVVELGDWRPDADEPGRRRVGGGYGMVGRLG